MDDFRRIWGEERRHVETISDYSTSIVAGAIQCALQCATHCARMLYHTQPFFGVVVCNVL